MTSIHSCHRFTIGHNETGDARLNLTGKSDGDGRGSSSRMVVVFRPSVSD